MVSENGGAKGHRLAPNGVGEHDLICPTWGKVCFAHLGIVAQLEFGGHNCPACGEVIRVVREVPATQ